MEFIARFINPVPDKELKEFRRNFNQSLKYALDAGKQNPDHSNSLMWCHLYNMCYNAAYQHDEELLDKIYAQEQELMPGDQSFASLVHFNRACIRISQHRFEEAIQMFEELYASNDHTNRSHVIHYLYSLHVYLGKEKEAVPYIRAYFEQWDKDNKTVGGFVHYCGFLDMLRVMALAGEYEEVIHFGKMRIEGKFRNDQYAHYLVGFCYLFLKDIKSAMPYFAYLFKRKNAYPGAYLDIARYYANEEKDFGKAIEYSIKAVKGFGNNPEHKEIRASLYKDLALLNEWLGDPVKAKAYRRQHYEAMGSHSISDLVTLFSKDPAAMDEYREWLMEKQAAAG